MRVTQIEHRGFPVARWLSVLGGGWFLISAFTSADLSAAARANRAIVGALIPACALYGIFVPAVRRLNTLLAIWMLVSSLFLFDRGPATWSGIVVATIVLLASIPAEAKPRST